MRRLFGFTIVILLFYTALFGETYRYDVKMLGIPVGETVETWTKSTKNSVCVTTFHSVSNLTVSRGASSITMQTKSTTKAHCDTFFPISIHSEATEGSTTTHIDATITGNKLTGRVSRNGVSEKHSLSLPKNTILFSHLYKAFSEKQFLKGTGPVAILNSETLSIMSMNPKAKTTTNGIEISILLSGIPIASIVKNGIIVTSSLQGGLITYALQGSPIPAPPVAQKSTDMLSSSALTNKGKRIRSPRSTKNVTFVITGKDIPEIPNSCSQMVVRKSSTKVEVTSLSKPTCKGNAQVSDISGNIYEDVDNKFIQKTAHKLFVSSHSNAEFIQKAISFVFDHIKDKSYKHGSLSASEVLKKRSGDCTEHSTLLSALLKSQGVPVRMLYGIVLTTDKRFLFHNWNAVFNGDRWTPVDATMNLIPADASRIVISIGGNSAGSREHVAISILNFLNKLSISVLESH